MRTYTPTTEFITPPENQGQIVTRSYAYAAEDGVIIEHEYDASDRTTRYYAYEDGDKDGSEWDPWNGVPALGASLGECRVSE